MWCSVQRCVGMCQNDMHPRQELYQLNFTNQRSLVLKIHFFLFQILFLCTWVFSLPIYMCTMCAPSVCGSQGNVSNPRDLSYRQL